MDIQWSEVKPLKLDIEELSSWELGQGLVKFSPLAYAVFGVAANYAAPKVGLLHGAPEYKHGITQATISRPWQQSTGSRHHWEKDGT